MRVFSPAHRDWRVVTLPLAGALLVVAAGAAGCGRSESLPAYQVYSVQGQVLLADGKPLDGGWITFVPRSDLPIAPSAEIGHDGRFSLVTAGSGEGAPAGEYKVRIDTPQIPQAKNRKSPIPARYHDEDSSNIVITVRAESNQLEPIHLK